MLPPIIALTLSLFALFVSIAFEVVRRRRDRQDEILQANPNYISAEEYKRRDGNLYDL